VSLNSRRRVPRIALRALRLQHIGQLADTDVARLQARGAARSTSRADRLPIQDPTYGRSRPDAHLDGGVRPTLASAS
jgi:hypothetical protein